MSFAIWLPTVLRGAGLGVVEMAGWQTRQSRAGFDPQGVVCHHTATSKATSDEGVRKLLRDGRSDLKGPLCQLGLERDGTYVVIAAGRGNHNGYGTWGNDSIGIEAYNDGVGEPWPEPQIDAYRRGVAAICRHQSWGVDRVKGHKETDAGRKIDPTGIDMVRFRADVLRLIIKLPAPSLTIASQEDIMLIIKCDKEPDRLFAPPVLIPISAATVTSLTKAGVKTVTVLKDELDKMLNQVGRALDG